MGVFSPEFALFTATVLAVYHMLPVRAQNAWLLAASYAFYASWGWHLPVLALVLAASTWLLARRAAGSIAALWTAVVVDVVALVVLREGRWLQLGALVGLGFAVMQAISYVADVHSGALRRRVGLVDVALYLAWFPRVLAGPIERASVFLPRLSAPRVVDESVVSVAFARIVEGLFRKIVLADALRLMVPKGLFETPSALPPGTIAWGVVASAFALYNEFAGYTSLVRGVSGLFGIELSPNFRQPFFSRSFTELWTRWHVSLSMWLRDYVYMPLARALLRRRSPPGRAATGAITSMAAMLASGFWHGGSAGMLLWGGLHGVFLTVERLWPGSPVVRRAPWVQTVQMLAVFVLGTLAFVPFRTSPPIALEIWSKLCGADGWTGPGIRLILLVASTLVLDALEYRTGDVDALVRLPLPARAAALAVALALLALSVGESTPPILYQGF